MKVVVYNIKDFERELLAIANRKIHDLTLISNPLSFSTIQYSCGKEVVIVSEDDRLDEKVLLALKAYGITKIITRSPTMAHIDLDMAASLDIKVANTPHLDRGAKGIAEQTILNLNLWSAKRCADGGHRCPKGCKRADGGEG